MCMTLKYAIVGSGCMAGESFGLACFDNAPTADATQRYARMTSVGVLSRCQLELSSQPLVEQLAKEAAQQNADAEQRCQDFRSVQPRALPPMAHAFAKYIVAKHTPSLHKVQ